MGLLHLIGRDEPKLLASGNHYPFSIEELPDRYRLYNVPYKGIYTFDWSKDLLGQGDYHTPDEWVNLQRENGFQLPSVPEYYATFQALHDNRDGEQSDLIQRILLMFQSNFNDYMMITSTKIQYHRFASDLIIHNYRTSGENFRNVNLAGSKKFVLNQEYSIDIPFERVIDALFDTSDYRMVDRVFRSVSGKTPYLWTIDRKVDEIIWTISSGGLDETTVRFLALRSHGNLFYINGTHICQDAGKAHGVAILPPVLRTPGTLSLTESMEGAVSMRNGGEISVAEE